MGKSRARAGGQGGSRGRGRAYLCVGNAGVPGRTSAAAAPSRASGPSAPALVFPRTEEGTEHHCATWDPRHHRPARELWLTSCKEARQSSRAM